MNTSAKGILLVVGAYVVTIGLAIVIVTLAIGILMMEPHGCSAMGRAMLMLWAVIAVLFVTSVVVVGVVARKFIAGAAGRYVVMGALGMALLASYIIIAFGLMVAFNC